MGSPGKPTFGLPTVGACFVATLALLVTACGPEYIEDDLDAAMQKETSPDVSGACGNGFIDTVYGEACDGEDFGGATCLSFGSLDGALTCTSRCRIDLALCIGQNFCGNGLVEGDESCDDGPGNEACRYGMASCEVCLPDCTLGPGDPSYCGDGVYDRTAYEQCDGSELAGATCTSLGHRDGDLSCDPYCRFDITGCDRSYCGDRLVQRDYEVCDIALNPDRACADGEETVEICVRCEFMETRPCVPVDAGSAPDDASLDDASTSADDAGMTGTDSTAPDDTGGFDGSGGTIEDSSTTPEDSGGTLVDADGATDHPGTRDTRDESGCSAAPAPGEVHMLWFAAAAAAMVRRRRRT